MAKTLYVGNLPWATTEEDLNTLFAQVVPVRSCRIISDRETGRSRGFGFVEVDDEHVEPAVETLNGAELGGRQIVVNEAKPRERRF